MDTSLSPSALFSPSKARQQLAQAQDWQHVDAWLASLYRGRAMPPFERNEDTLKALLALAAANERADEERDMVEHLEHEALAELQKMDSSFHPSDSSVLNALTASLTPEGLQSLDSLARLIVTLDAPICDSETLAHALLQTITPPVPSPHHAQTVRTLLDYLNRSLVDLETQYAIFTSSDFVTPAVLQTQTTDHNRQTKLLRSKIAEYTARLSGLPAAPSFSVSSGLNPGARSDAALDIPSSAALGEMVKLVEEVRAATDRVGELEGRVHAFKNLPANREEARQEVRSLERELTILKGRRDRLFEGLVG